jgi:HD-GYP domain-containing protein (c-di-GMP phosphodiesterase class II)
VVAELRKSKRPVVSVRLDPRAHESDSSFWRRGSVVGIPLVDGDRFLGAVCLDSETQRAAFGPDALAFVETVAAVCALALASARARTRMLEAARMSEDLGSVLDLRTVLDRALGRIVELTRAEQGFLVIRDDETGRLQLWGAKDVRGKSMSEPGQRFLSEQIVGKVLETGEAVLSDNVAGESDLGEARSVIQFGLASILCVPIRSKKAIHGAVYLENRFEKGVFDEEDGRLVQLLADRAGMAIDNARLYDQQRQIVQALANAVEARDQTTSTHVQRVSQYAVAVGRRLGLAEERLATLEQSAMLHDIGKIGIPDRVLLKPGGLDDEEWELMRSHPQLGHDIVGPVRLPAEVKAGILHHQESWDGTGYPTGLAGDRIPLFSRIIAVVDAYDAMVADRPYRGAMSRSLAASEIDRCAGTKFDPDVVMAFLEVLEAEERRSTLPPVR